MINKLVDSIRKAVADIHDGATVMIGGFGEAGSPIELIHALIDQEYSGDVNIVPSFRWYNPTKLLSHLSEKDLMELMEGGEHSAYPQIESIRLCTQISRTMEEILLRFESGDLRPDASEYNRPRSSRRRPTPTRADREAMREHELHSDKVKKPEQNKVVAKAAIKVVKESAKLPAKKKAAARKKSSKTASAKSAKGGKDKVAGIAA